MPSRDGDESPETIRSALVAMLSDFASELQRDDLRAKVLALVPIARAFRSLGTNLIPADGSDAARDRVLSYLRRYPLTVIAGDELMIVSGIGEWARRLRELRVQFGWRIVTGATLKQMAAEGEPLGPEFAGAMRVTDYILIDAEEDRQAAHRWNTANSIRRRPGSVKDRVLAFLQANIGAPVTGEELRYVGGNRTEWARRVRELRTEEGWQVVTRNTGRPDLPIGAYELESSAQLPSHDRVIKDAVRREVLERDEYKCTSCGWSREDWTRENPRALELHHVEHHARGGANTADNLTALCNVCHDSRHRDER